MNVNGQCDVKSRTFARFAFDVDFAAGPRYDVLHDAKPQTHCLPCRLGSEKRLKNLIEILRCDATAVVRELQLDVFIL